MKRFSAVLASLCIASTLTGCYTVDGIFGEEDPQISNVELQALQTREYEATYAQVFSAAIGTFQNYGYTIQSADRETGLVIAKTTTQAEMNFGYARNEYQKATAFVEQIAENRVRIRISLVKHVSASGSYGMQGEKEANITRPQIYQDMFKKIQESLFLKKNL